jgi:Protein of unknown function (DUF4241)
MSLVERTAAALVELLGEDREARGVRSDRRRGDATPFARPVPAGSQRVRALVAEYEDDGGRRVAAAVVELGAARAVTWDASSVPSGDDDFDGYPVDSGTGCYASPEAVQRFAGCSTSRTNPLSTALEQTYVHP